MLITAELMLKYPDEPFYLRSALICSPVVFNHLIKFVFYILLLAYMRRGEEGFV